MGNSSLSAGCQSREAERAPTVGQAAQWLLDAFDALFDGPEGEGLYGRENSRGEPAGDAVEEARHQLGLVLATTRHARNLTNADFDEEIFERVWRSDAVQQAGQRLGWRGVAEAMWSAALAYEKDGVDCQRQAGS